MSPTVSERRQGHSAIAVGLTRVGSWCETFRKDGKVGRAELQDRSPSRRQKLD